MYDRGAGLGSQLGKEHLDGPVIKALMVSPRMVDDAEKKTSQHHIKLEIQVSYPKEDIDAHQTPLGASATKEFLAVVCDEICLSE